MKRILISLCLFVAFALSPTVFAMQSSIRKLQASKTLETFLVDFNNAYTLYDSALRDECVNAAEVVRKCAKINQAKQLFMNVRMYRPNDYNFNEMYWHATFLLARCHVICCEKRLAIDVLRGMVHELFGKPGYEYWYLEAVNLYGTLLLLDEMYIEAESVFGKIFVYQGLFIHRTPVKHYLAVESTFKNPMNQHCIEEILCGLAVALWGQKNSGSLSENLIERISLNEQGDFPFVNLLKSLSTQIERYEREFKAVLDPALLDSAKDYKNLYHAYLSYFFEL